MNKSRIVSFLVVAASLMSAGAFPAAGQGNQAQPRETRAFSLQDAVRMALARSPQILLAEAQAIRIREAVRETRSLNRPQVNTGTGAAYNNGYPLSLEGAAPSIFQVTGSQSIFSKKNSNLIREAEESSKAARLGAESARNEISSRTALVYYQLHQLRKAVEIASGMLDAAREQEKEIDTLHSAGRVRPVELSLARQATRSAEHQVFSNQERARLAETELHQLTGLDESVSIGTVEPQIENPIFGQQGEALYRQALECSPEILQAESNIRAKEFHVEAERGENLPKADIIGEYALFSRTNNYADFFNRFSRNNFIIGVTFQIPIFNGFRTNSRVAQSRQEVLEARYRADTLKSDLRLNIERGRSALRIARDESEVARSDVDAAREMVQVNEALLEGGRISPKEMQDSRSQLQQKEMALLDAEQILFQRKLELLRAAGSIVSALQ